MGAVLLNQYDENHLQNWQIKRLFSYWMERRNGQDLPSRDSIDPLDIPHILPSLFLVDVNGQNQRFRYRLVGTKYEQKAERPLTGQWLDDINDPGYRKHWSFVYASCTKNRIPYYGSGYTPWFDNALVAMEWVVMPLSSDGEVVDMLLCGAEFSDMPVCRPNHRLKRFTESLRDVLTATENNLNGDLMRRALPVPNENHNLAQSLIRV